MFQLFERGIRGGRSAVSGDRYIKSDNNIKIINVDKTKIYAWALMQCLSYADFKTRNGNDKKLDRILNNSNDNEVGYCLLVDLNYS